MRKSGVLLHIASLPSPYGIGTMGKAAYDFVDFLRKSGQTYWQILPICPTSYGDSPYQSFSTFAGNPYFIDLDQLANDGLLLRSEYETLDWECSEDNINYGALYYKRYPILQLAVKRLLNRPEKEFTEFCKENDWWLSEFALFMALKDVHGGNPWWNWEQGLRNRESEAIKRAEAEYQDSILFWKALQYLFFRQWKLLKSYANEKGIRLIGDLPIYVSLDSVDVWSKPELFQLDENKVPKEVAGCPPDGFSAVGQLWGNPLFDWDYMERDNYSWWVRRIEYLCKVYHTLRIDHFRGFDTYYAIPYGSPDAIHGQWKQGPGMKLFHAINQAIGQQSIIAEDLGYLTDSVRQLLRDSGFPGMRVLEFAFDSRDASGNEYLLHNFVRNCVAYTGTHDNDTILGWFSEASAEDTAYAKEYLRIGEDEELNWAMLKALWSSVADLVIAQAQDLLGLGSEARMNIPSTVGGNWCWRAAQGAFTDEIADRLRSMTELYGRG